MARSNIPNTFFTQLGFPRDSFTALAPSMGRLFDSVFEIADGVNSDKTFSPRIEVREKKDSFLVHAELPGLAENEIDIQLEEGKLSISGEKKTTRTSEEDTVHHTELKYGKFTRVFSLPKEIDENNVEASFKNGVLEINIPKAEITAPKRKKVEIRSH